MTLRYEKLKLDTRNPRDDLELVLGVRGALVVDTDTRVEDVDLLDFAMQLTRWTAHLVGSPDTRFVYAPLATDVVLAIESSEEGWRLVHAGGAVRLADDDETLEATLTPFVMSLARALGEVYGRERIIALLTGAEPFYPSDPE